MMTVHSVLLSLSSDLSYYEATYIVARFGLDGAVRMQLSRVVCIFCRVFYFYFCALKSYTALHRNNTRDAQGKG